MRDKLTTAGELAGAIFITAGLFLFSVPLGLIGLGVALVGASFLAGDS